MVLPTRIVGSKLKGGFISFSPGFNRVMSGMSDFPNRFNGLSSPRKS
jgi:hypothetical protein